MGKAFIISTIYFLLSASPALAQSVDIIWQGEVYTPPFYEGRALWANQSPITLVAVPESLGNPASLNYKWSRNGTVLGNTNGVGRNSLVLVDSILSKPQTIKVEIVSGDGTITAESSIIINPGTPGIVIYEESPLYGIMLHREVGGNYMLREPEVTFSAFPLFFRIFGQADSNVSYVWRTNAGGSGTGYSAVYRAPEGGNGEALISVEIKNTREILQSANKSFLVKFGEE